MELEKNDWVRINDTQSEYHGKSAKVIKVGVGFLDVQVGTLRMRVLPQQVMFVAKAGAV